MGWRPIGRAIDAWDHRLRETRIHTAVNQPSSSFIGHWQRQRYIFVAFSLNQNIGWSALHDPIDRGFQSRRRIQAHPGQQIVPRIAGSTQSHIKRRKRETVGIEFHTVPTANAIVEAGSTPTTPASELVKAITIIRPQREGPTHPQLQIRPITAIQTIAQLIHTHTVRWVWDALSLDVQVIEEFAG